MTLTFTVVNLDMKFVNLIFIVPIVVLSASCQKEIDNTVDSNGKPYEGNLVKFKQGTGIGADTVYLITYDSLNRVYSITDSTHGDTLVASYDDSSRLLEITEKFGSAGSFHASYSYDPEGLKQIEYNFFNEDVRYVFEYVNGVVAKKAIILILELAARTSFMGTAPTKSMKGT